MGKLFSDIPLMVWKGYGKLVERIVQKYPDVNLEKLEFSVSVSLADNRLSAKILTVPDIGRKLFFYFCLFHDGKPVKHSGWSSCCAHTWVLKESGIYSVCAYIGYPHKNKQKFSKTVEYFIPEDKREFESFLKKSERYEYLFKQELEFISCNYPYCDFTLISATSDFGGATADGLRGVASDGFSVYNLPKTGEWENTLITNGELKTDNVGGKFLFSGLTIHNRAFILGSEDFQDDFRPGDILDNTGSYNMVFINKDGIRLWSDYFNFCHLYYYSDAFVSVISNRYHLILIALSKLSIHCQLNMEKAKVTLSTANLYITLHNFIKEMDVHGVYQLEAYKDILISENGLELINNNLYGEISENRAFDEKTYKNLVENGKEEILADLNLVLSDSRFEYVIADLSGGIDSRTTYAALTNATVNTDKIVINTSNTGEKDLRIATAINNVYKFPFNTLPQTHISHPLRNMDQMTRSFFLGTNFEHNLHTHTLNGKGTLQLYGAGGDILMRPFYSRNYLKSQFTGLEELVDRIVSDCTPYLIGSYDKTFYPFRELYREQLESFPLEFIYNKLEFQWLMMGNGYHFNTQFKSKVGRIVWSCLQSKSIYTAHLMSLSSFRNIKLHLDVVSLLNPSVVRVPFDKNANNSDLRRLNRSLLGYSPSAKKIHLHRNYLDWERSDKALRANAKYIIEDRSANAANWEIKNASEITYNNLLFAFKQLMQSIPTIKNSMGMALYHYIKNNKDDKTRIRYLYNKITSLLDQFKIISKSQDYGFPKEDISEV